MGLSFHYSGKIKDEHLINELVGEVADIADSLHWDRVIFGNGSLGKFNGNFIYDEKFSGISISPPECEPVFLCFRKDGNLYNPVSYQFYKEDPVQFPIGFTTTLSVKTHYAGIEIHKILIKLFRHLGKKYLLDLKIVDEGNYWETDDEEVLKQQFRLYDDMVESFAIALECTAIQKGETIEEYIIRVAGRVKK
jgi:hypothetical protein